MSGGKDSHSNLAGERVGEDNSWRVDSDALLDQGPFTPEAIEALQAEVMTISEIAQGLGIPYSTLAEAARKGKFKVRRSGNTWLTTIADVQRWQANK